MQIQKEMLKPEAVKTNKTLTTGSPNPDGGKDNRP